MSVFLTFIGLAFSKSGVSRVKNADECQRTIHIGPSHGTTNELREISYLNFGLKNNVGIAIVGEPEDASEAFRGEFAHFKQHQFRGLK